MKLKKNSNVQILELIVNIENSLRVVNHGLTFNAEIQAIS